MTDIVHSRRAYNKYASKMKARIEAGVVWMNNLTDEFWDDYAKKFELDRTSLLDGRWIDLDISTLHLQYADVCVLGQAGGNYYHVASFADLSDQKASQLGFYLDEEDYGLDESKEFIPQDWSNHTELWIAKINQLRRQRDKLIHSKSDKA